MSREIKFGTTFTPAFETSVSEFVVIYPWGEGESFGASPIKKTDSDLIVCLPNTLDLEDINEILPKSLTLDKIIDGLNNYLGPPGLSEAGIEDLRQQSIKPPRQLQYKLFGRR
jgi:hypothetical protein